MSDPVSKTTIVIPPMISNREDVINWGGRDCAQAHQVPSPPATQNTNPVALRLRAISTGGGSQPNSKIKDLCSDGAAEIDRLEKIIDEMSDAIGRSAPT